MASDLVRTDEDEVPQSNVDRGGETLGEQIRRKLRATHLRNRRAESNKSTANAYGCCPGGSLRGGAWRRRGDKVVEQVACRRAFSYVHADGNVPCMVPIEAPEFTTRGRRPL